MGLNICCFSTAHVFSSTNTFSTAESKILISKLKIYVLKLIYGSVWYSYNLKLNFIPDSDCFETSYVRFGIASTANAWCLRVTYFATSINVPWPALVTLNCGSETTCRTSGHRCKYLWPHAEISSERVSWAAGCTNPAVSTLHQSKREWVDEAVEWGSETVSDILGEWLWMLKEVRYLVIWMITKSRSPEHRVSWTSGRLFCP
jgi:hypothetical protein